MHHFFLFLIGAIACLALSGSGCTPAADEKVQTLWLGDSLQTLGTSNRQLYWTPADTAQWSARMAAADSLVITADEGLRLYQDGQWYVARRIAGQWRASQPYPGWERRVDSSAAQNIIRLLNNDRVAVRITATDTVLGGDSLRIGIMQITGKAFAWQDVSLAHPDYLILAPYGSQRLPIAMDQPSVGPISRQTVFRVGRQQYVLRSVAEDRRSLTLAPVASARGLSLTAAFDPYYKRIPAKNLDGQPVTIPKARDRELIVYFFHLGRFGGKDVRALDSLYRALPAAQREMTELVFVSRHSFTDSLRNFVRRAQISLPVYQSSSRTCARMPCLPFLPYGTVVNRGGRITHQYFPRTALATALEEKITK